MDTKKFFISEVTLFLRLDARESAHPSEWDWASLLDMDPDDVGYIESENEHIVEIPWDSEDESCAFPDDLLERPAIEKPKLRRFLNDEASVFSDDEEDALDDLQS